MIHIINKIPLHYSGVNVNICIWYNTNEGREFEWVVHGNIKKVNINRFL